MRFVVEMPDSYVAEREYVVRVVLTHFLGLDYELRLAPNKVVSIALNGQPGRIVLADVLFQTPRDKWLTSSSLPSQPLAVHKPDVGDLRANLVSKQVPIIYGSSSSDFVRENNDPGLNVPLDIFGSIFFMLSRYEELVCATLDAHQRVPAEASLAAKEGFLDRPIVDEYVELLWAAIEKLWPGVKRSTRSFRMNLSCDVDRPFDLSVHALSSAFRRVMGDLLKRKSAALALDTINYARSVQAQGISADKMWTFEMMMDACEALNLKCSFYFITDINHERDGKGYWGDQRIQGLLTEIHARGHAIGLHGSYTAYDDEARIKNEFDRLLGSCEQIGIKQSNWGGRQHYLRWEAPTTWRCWAKAGLDYDSTVGYANRSGFRCGTCHDFPVFDCVLSQELSIQEKPLIVMEGTLLSHLYEGLAPEDALERMVYFKNICRQFDGSFNLLWHNSSLVYDREKKMFDHILAA